MLQEEEYDSDTSDEDFVPQGAESEDEVVSDVPDDDDCEGDEGAPSKKKKKKASKSVSTPVEEPKEAKDDAYDEKRANDLWADFLDDEDDKPKPQPKTNTITWASLLGNKKTNDTSKDSTNKDSNASSTRNIKDKSTSINKPTEPSTVKITKIFEFAGEEVRVEEEVDSNSVEAQTAKLKEKQSDSKDETKSSPVGVKRPAGLASVLTMIDNKKQKLSTLQKTKIDWLNYKTSEGIVDELEMHKKSKDGYLEKKEFLERADMKQFEIERNLRMGSKRSTR